MFKFDKDRYRFAFWSLVLSAGVSVATKDIGAFMYTLLFMCVGLGIAAMAKNT